MPEETDTLRNFARCLRLAMVKFQKEVFRNDKKKTQYQFISFVVKREFIKKCLANTAGLSCKMTARLMFDSFSPSFKTDRGSRLMNIL